MEKLNLLLTESDPTAMLSTDGVSQMSKTIAEYGIMAVCCAVFLIMAMVMFVVIIKRLTKEDNAKTQSILEAVKMLKDMKDNNFNIAECFDRHNVTATHEFKEIEAGIEKALSKLAEGVDNFAGLKQQMSIVEDRQLEIKRQLESLTYEIEQLRKKTAD